MSAVKNKNAAFYATAPTQTIASTSTSANVQIQTNASNLSQHCRVYNAGSVVVWIAFGNSNTVAASSTCPTTSIPILPTSSVILTAPFEYVAAVSASSANIYFTPGDGGV